MIETSIIIPVRNQRESLLLTLKSLREQIKETRIFEIVICDDGSNDGTSEAIKRLRYPIFFKYIRNDPPLGRAANRNLGFERSSGRNLIFLDGDMVPAEGFIKAMLMEGGADIVKVGGIKFRPNEKRGRLEKYLYSRGRYDTHGMGQFLPGKMLASGNFMISRNNFVKVGGFDPNFKGWGGEDIDLGLKLEALGIAIKNEPAALTYHYHKRTLESLMDDFYNFGRNSFEYLIKKHPAFLEQFPAHRLGLAKAGVVNRLVAALTINSSLLKLAGRVVSASSNFAWPDYIFDYLFWGHLALGYKDRAKLASK